MNDLRAEAIWAWERENHSPTPDEFVVSFMLAKIFQKVASIDERLARLENQSNQRRST